MKEKGGGIGVSSGQSHRCLSNNINKSVVEVSRGKTDQSRKKRVSCYGSKCFNPKDLKLYI